MSELKVSILQVDFKHPVATDLDIKDWMKNAGHPIDKGRLKLSQPNMKMALVNSVNFNFKWKFPFDATKTDDMPWKGSDDENSVKVPMLQTTQDFRVTTSKSCNCTMLELPLDHPGCSLFLILPNEVSGFQQMELVLKDPIVDELIAENLESKPRKLRVKIPRFSLSWSGGLNKFLKSLGLEDIFETEQSEVKGVGVALDVPLGKVFQNVRLNVNEYGIGDTLINDSSSLPINSSSFGTKLELAANHPFFFVLKNVDHGLTLLLGRVINPQPPKEKQFSFKAPHLPEINNRSFVQNSTRNETTSVDKSNETSSFSKSNKTTSFSKFNETSSFGQTNETAIFDKSNETTSFDKANETSSFGKANETSSFGKFNETSSFSQANETVSFGKSNEISGLGKFNETSSFGKSNETTDPDISNGIPIDGNNSSSSESWMSIPEKSHVFTSLLNTTFPIAATTTNHTKNIIRDKIITQNSNTNKNESKDSQDYSENIDEGPETNIDKSDSKVNTATTGSLDNTTNSASNTSVTTIPINLNTPSTAIKANTTGFAEANIKSLMNITNNGSLQNRASVQSTLNNSSTGINKTSTSTSRLRNITVVKTAANGSIEATTASQQFSHNGSIHNTSTIESFRNKTKPTAVLTSTIKTTTTEHDKSATSSPVNATKSLAEKIQEILHGVKPKMVTIQLNSSSKNTAAWCKRTRTTGFELHKISDNCHLTEANSTFLGSHCLPQLTGCNVKPDGNPKYGTFRKASIKSFIQWSTFANGVISLGNKIHENNLKAVENKTSSCADTVRTCSTKLAEMENCDSALFLLQDFNNRCDVINKEEVSKAKKREHKGFFANLWDDIKSTFSRIG